MPFLLCFLSVLVIKIFCETVTKQCYKITQECDYKMMSDTCILIIYTSQEQYNYFFRNVTHKAKCEQNGMLVKCLDKKKRRYTMKTLCVCHKKSTFLILCHRDLIPPTNIPPLSQKEISYFGPRKGIRYFIQENKAG